MNPQEFTGKLVEDCGNNLESVILYGSAADGEFHKGFSDYNMILVLRNIAPVELKRTTQAVKKWTGSKNPVPIFFTKDIIEGAADVFPIEFTDIRERHKVLYGPDPFRGLEIDRKNLRHQCEHELRSKMLTLRSNFALLAEEPKKMIRLILDSSSSIFSIFKGVLALSGTASTLNSKKALVEQIESLTGSNMNIFFEIIDIRMKKIIWRKDEALEKFEQYLTSIAAVIKYVDSQGGNL